MSRLHLNARQQRQLHDQLRTARTARRYRRPLALVEAAQGKPIAHIARSLGVNRRSFYHGQQRYTAHHDPAALVERKGSGHPSVWPPQLRTLLEQSLAGKPEPWGYQASEWPVPLLIEHVAAQSGPRVSEATVRRQLWRLGSVWTRPRYRLQPEPAREKKARPAPPTQAAGAAQRHPLRGRNCPVVVPPPAGVLGQTGAASGGGPHGQHCAARGLRPPHCRHGPPPVCGARPPARRGLSGLSADSPPP
jgi:hypothetical protein